MLATNSRKYLLPTRYYQIQRNEKYTTAMESRVCRRAQMASPMEMRSFHNGFPLRLWVDMAVRQGGRPPKSPFVLKLLWKKCTMEMWPRQLNTKGHHFARSAMAKAVPRSAKKCAVTAMVGAELRAIFFSVLRQAKR